MAKVSLSSQSKHISKNFKAVFCFTRDGSGSLEGFGPFSTVYFKLLYDPEKLYLYLPQEKILYTGENTAENLRKILYFDWESSYFIDYLSANVPFDPFLAEINSVSVKKEYIIKGEIFNKQWRARIAPFSVPDILELSWLDKSEDAFLDIHYASFDEIEGYRIPHHISFWQKKDNLSVDIKFISIKINEVMTQKNFLPPDNWINDNELIKKIPLP